MLLIALVNPHVLLLDEPTNHLDMRLGQDGSVRLSVRSFCLVICFAAKPVAADVAGANHKLLIELKGKMHTTLQYVQQSNKASSQTREKYPSATHFSCSLKEVAYTEQKAKLASVFFEIRT